LGREIRVRDQGCLATAGPNCSHPWDAGPKFDSGPRYKVEFLEKRKKSAKFVAGLGLSVPAGERGSDGAASARRGGLGDF